MISILRSMKEKILNDNVIVTMNLIHLEVYLHAKDYFFPGKPTRMKEIFEDTGKDEQNKS